MNHFCSIVDEGYIRRAVVFHKSLESWCKPYHWHVLVLDHAALNAMCKLDNATVLPYGDWCACGLQIPNILLKAQGNLDWNEFIWALKSVWLLHLLDIDGLSAVSYIDADCYFFAPPDELFDEIGEASLAVVPHRFSPAQEGFGVNGIYNGGYIYVTNDLDVVACLEKWLLVCAEHRNGRHTEQKHLNTWPGKWGAHVIEHVGVDLAPWNQEGQYTYTSRGGQIYVDGLPLIFYHFHQRLKPHYPIDPFVKEHIYKPYSAFFEPDEEEEEEKGENE